jgi:hypothetical protein
MAMVVEAPDALEQRALDMGIDVEKIRREVTAELTAKPAMRGKRTISEDEWRAELGQNQAGYAAAASKHFAAIRHS